MGVSSEQPAKPSLWAPSQPVGASLQPPPRLEPPAFPHTFSQRQSALCSALLCFPALLRLVCLLPLPVFGSAPPVKQVALLPPTGR